jgi:redox-sensitive bicupin YhaK (pirin superfamily)
MIRLRRARQRYESAQPGIVTRHCFSAGAHYDPDNTSFGPIVGVDEHTVGPGAGFATHAHRGVDILTWVLDGALRHEDGSAPIVITPGVVLHQVTASGVRHSELNASATQPLRFVQTTWVSDATRPGHALGEPPLVVGLGRIDVVRSAAALSGTLMHLFVARGSFEVGGEVLNAGDSLRATNEHLDVRPVDAGSRELLVWTTVGPS